MKINGFFDVDYGGSYTRAVETSKDSKIYKIYPRSASNDIAGSTNHKNAGWCLKHHATFNGYLSPVKPWTVIDAGYNDAKGYSNIPDYLLYNLVRVYESEYDNGTLISNGEIEFFKKRLGIEDVADLNQIFEAEQKAIWEYTNPGESYSDEIVQKIKNAVSANQNYSIDKENSIKVTKKDESKNSAQNNTFGLFNVKNEAGVYVEYKIQISTDGKNYKDVSEYTAHKPDGTAISDLSTYNGDFYIQTADAKNQTATLKVIINHYITTAKYVTTKGEETTVSHQPILYLDRVISSINAENKIEKLSGSFKLDVVKYIKGTTKKLGGAGFKVVVNNGTKDIYKSTKDEYTKDDGILEIKNLPIEKENITYKITITETVEPKGYIGLSGPITFTAKSKLKDDKKGYELVVAKRTVANAKKVEVKANEILVETENTKTKIDIHKGVKTVENQDSGYYYDEKTGKEYTEEDLEKLEHKWVVETTIPEEVEDYTKYIVSDPIDESRLEFSGLENVIVQTIDKSGKVEETLTKDKDYKAEYKEGSLNITYVNGNFKGEFLKKRGIQNLKIRVTFNTTFKVNENGKLAVLDGIVTNAQNRAKLTYNIGTGTDVTKYSESPEVHTGAVSVFKYEDTNGNGKHDEGEKALVGAEFKIALTEEDAKAGNFVKIGGKELTAVSNEDGIATFTGLSFGGDAKDDEENLKNGLYKYNWETASRDYYIVETVTPAGYEKLTDTIRVKVSKNTSEMIDLTDQINNMESVGNRPLTFDLALRKWVTQAIVIEDGKTVVTETGHKAEDDPEAVVKVDLKKKKLNDVIVKFKYSIRITNEGEVDGEAQEISDYIPKGLKFVKEDNPDWEEVEGKVVTEKLKGVTLKHGESAEVEIILTWINSEENMGVMTNTAEISKDYNEYGYDDIDSTPNNKKEGEDDIDDAPVMLTVKTGSEIVTYVGIAVGMIVIISLGVCLIKKSFKEL